MWNETPDGENCELKLSLLQKEGVEFDQEGRLLDDSRWWDDFRVGDKEDLKKALVAFSQHGK